MCRCGCDHQRSRQLVAEKKFPNDLYYRVNVFPIAGPPLRRRLKHPMLVAHFVHRYRNAWPSTSKRLLGPLDALVHYPGREHS